MPDSYQVIKLFLPVTSEVFCGATGLLDGNADANTPSTRVGAHEGLQGLINYLHGINGGVRQGQIDVVTYALHGVATLTVSGAGSSNNETMILCNVTFTAKTSGATGNEFDISATPATQATNMANAFNASADLTGIVTAEANGAVVTLTSFYPGFIGNGLQISESLTNVALSSFVTEDIGIQDVTYELNLR